MDQRRDEVLKVYADRISKIIVRYDLDGRTVTVDGL
jgi:hypothetical protein